MALSPSHGQCLFSFILPQLYRPLRATKLSHVVKMILLLSGFGCVFEKRARESVCASVCVSISACALVVVSVCCHELL